jgi:hypothetical protein
MGCHHWQAKRANFSSNIINNFLKQANLQFVIMQGNFFFICPTEMSSVEWQLLHTLPPEYRLSLSLQLQVQPV